MPLLTYAHSLPGGQQIEFAPYAAETATQHRALHGGNMPGCGWLDPRLEAAELAAITGAAARIRGQAPALLCLGVGGSQLSGRAITESLAHRAAPGAARLYWGGWNLSPLYHQQLLRELDDQPDIAVCVISKRGASLETRAAFALAKDYLQQRYGAAWPSRVYAVTDPGCSALRAEAEEQGYTVLAAPPHIAGRYSALTAIGLLPAAAAGIDIRALLRGAAQAAADLDQPDILDNPCYQYAAACLYAHRQLGKAVELISIVEPGMSCFSRWLRQIFAESEGKQGCGIFPAELLYSNDLHSLGQFVAAGAPLFFETLIYPRQAVPAEGLAGAAGYQRLQQALLRAVCALRRNSLPLNLFALKALDEASLGYALYFFMKAAALRALLLGSDPFSQPAVEEYKRELARLLAADGEEG